MKKILLIPTVLTISTAPLTGLIGCGKKINAILSGGKLHLYGQLETSHTDSSAWQLKDGETILDATYSIVGGQSASNSIHVDNDGKVSWDNNIGQGDYSFRIQAKYKGEKYQSEDISLSIGPKCETFADDGWDVIAFWANKGSEALHYVYEGDCTNNSNFPNTLIGLNKTVKINNLDHNVRVIGEDEDEDLHGKNLALTFQFTNLISSQEDDGKFISIPWDDGADATNHNYWESKLCQFLNNNVSGDEITSVLEMIKAGGNDELADNIKQVTRGVSVYDGDLTTDLKFKLSIDKTKIFCPVLANYFSQTGIDNTAQSILKIDEKTLYKSEGKQYSFYANSDNVGDEPIDEATMFECLNFVDFRDEQTENYCWFSSPWVGAESGANQVSWCACNKSVVTRSFYGAVFADLGSAAPCFCL